MKVQKRYFVGKNKPGIWASVYTYKPSSEKIFSARGEIFAAILIEGPKEFDSSVVGNLLLDILHESYFESAADSTLEALEEAVKATKNRLLTLVENDETAALHGINFDLITLVIKEPYFFSVRIGDGGVKIYRSGSLQDLAAGFRDPTGEKDYAVLSGLFEKGDVFLLSTPNINEYYSEEELLESVSDYSEIVLKNKMLEDDSKIGLLLLGVGLEEKQDLVSAVIEEDKNLQYVNKELTTDEQEEEPEEAPTPFSERKFSLNKLKEQVLLKFDETRDFVNSKLQSFKNKQSTQTPLPDTETTEITAQEDQPAGSRIEPDMKRDSTIVVVLKRMLVKAKVWLLKFWLFIKEDILGMKGGNGVYLRGRRKQLNYRVIAVLAIVFVLILYGAIKIRTNAVESARQERENRRLVQELSTDVDEIESNSVFTISAPDNIPARENVLVSIQELQNKINSTNISEDYRAELEGYAARLQDLNRKLQRIIEVENPVIVSDLGANFEGAVPSDITLKDGNLYVTDSARNVIYQVGPEGGQREFFNDLQTPRLIVADPDEGLVVLDESDTALGLLDIKTGQMRRFPGMTNAKLSTTVEMDAYTVGTDDIRLYLAMSVSPQVQQINKRGGAYSVGPQSRWEGENYHGITDIALLDGKFILIKEGAGLSRHYVNSEITTNIIGLLGSDSLQTATKLTTDALYIYIADPANQRILVFTKSRGDNVDFIDLIAQYKYTGQQNIFKNIVDIVVDSVNIYVLDGAKLYKLPKSELDSYLF